MSGVGNPMPPGSCRWKSLEGEVMEPLTVRMEPAILVHCSNSILNGDILVEDIVRENSHGFVIRRMRFVSNLALEQCEVRFTSTQPGPDSTPVSASTATDGEGPRTEGIRHPRSNGTAKLTLDTSYLAYDCVRGMCLALALLPTSKRPALSPLSPPAPLKSMSIGLAGGALPTFLRHNVAALSVDCVEIDGSVVDIAQEFFGFTPDDHLRVLVGDALECVHQIGDGQYDMILIDVNEVDERAEVEAPPITFFSKPFLSSLARILCPGGVLCYNVLCSSRPLFNRIVQRLQVIFDNRVFFLQSSTADIDSNYVVFAQRADTSPWPPCKEDLATAAEELERAVPAAKSFGLAPRVLLQFTLPLPMRNPPPPTGEA